MQRTVLIVTAYSIDFPPNSLALNFVKMSAPPKPHLSWTLIIDDATMTWSLQPRGYLSISAILYGLLLFIPFITAVIAAYIFMRSHYGILYNQFGVISKGRKKSRLGNAFRLCRTTKDLKHLIYYRFTRDPVVVSGPWLAGLVVLLARYRPSS